MNVTTIEKIIRFSDWMSSRRRVPLPEDIMDVFAVSRATAYRWLSGYVDAKNLIALEPGPFGWGNDKPTGTLPTDPMSFRRRWADSRTGREVGASA